MALTRPSRWRRPSVPMSRAMTLIGGLHACAHSGSPNAMRETSSGMSFPIAAKERSVGVRLGERSATSAPIAPAVLDRSVRAAGSGT